MDSKFQKIIFNSQELTLNLHTIVGQNKIDSFSSSNNLLSGKSYIIKMFYISRILFSWDRNAIIAFKKYAATNGVVRSVPKLANRLFCP